MNPESKSKNRIPMIIPKTKKKFTLGSLLPVKEESIDITLFICF